MKKPSKNEKEYEKRLNPMQRAFALEYLKNGNATRAAIKAGYKERSAASQANALLKNPKLIDYMDEVKARLESDKIADIDEVMQYFTRVLRQEESDQFGLEVSIADRTNAGKELMKRLTAGGNEKMPAVVIINDIPRPEHTESEEDVKAD